MSRLGSNLWRGPATILVVMVATVVDATFSLWEWWEDRLNVVALEEP